MASRVLGLVRDMVMAATFGNGAVLDAFTVAFRAPNLARRLFGEGALTTAFLPVFIREMDRHGKQSAWRLASAVLCTLVIALSTIVLMAMIVLWGISLAWSGGPEGTLLFGLTAAMLPYLLLICVAAQVSAVLNALDHFFWPAMLPVLLNAVWIVGVLWLVPQFSMAETQAYVVAGIVLFGGVIQLGAGLPTLRRLGFRFDKRWRDSWPQVAEIMRGMLPVLLGLSITQLNVLVDSVTAWAFSAPEVAVDLDRYYPLESGTASALYFGQRLFHFPMGVFAVALGTVLFPLLSRHAERQQFDRLRDDLSLGIGLVMAIGIPASVGLAILCEPLTVLLFERGEFTPEDSRQTAAMIQAYGLGIWAACALLIVQRGFYAIGDRITPMRVGICGLAVNVTLNFALMFWIGGVGLAFASTVAVIVQAVALTFLVQNRIGQGLNWGVVAKSVLKSSVAAAVMGVACWISMNRAAELGSRTLSVVVPLAASIAVYFAVAKLLKMEELTMLLRRKAVVD